MQSHKRKIRDRIRARVRRVADGLAYGYIVMRGIRFWHETHSMSDSIRIGKTPVETCIDFLSQLGCIDREFEVPRQSARQRTMDN